MRLEYSVRVWRNIIRERNNLIGGPSAALLNNVVKGSSLMTYLMYKYVDIWRTGIEDNYYCMRLIFANMRKSETMSTRT